MVVWVILSRSSRMCVGETSALLSNYDRLDHICNFWAFKGKIKQWLTKPAFIQFYLSFLLTLRHVSEFALTRECGFQKSHRTSPSLRAIPKSLLMISNNENLLLIKKNILLINPKVYKRIVFFIPKVFVGSKIKTDHVLV